MSCTSPAQSGVTSEVAPRGKVWVPLPGEEGEDRFLFRFAWIGKSDMSFCSKEDIKKNLIERYSYTRCC